MNKDISQFANDSVYKGIMKTVSQEVSDLSLEFPKQVDTGLSWIENLKKRSVTWIKTEKILDRLTLEERQSQKQKNYIEAAVCKRIIDNLSESCIDTARITVMTPFLDQASLLRTHLSQYGVRVVTFDKGQALDCDIVIVSCSKQTAEKGACNKELRHINVALTRARMSLIIIGSEKYL